MTSIWFGMLCGLASAVVMRHFTGGESLSVVGAASFAGTLIASLVGRYHNSH
jgi:hypothetical protein